MSSSRGPAPEPLAILLRFMDRGGLAPIIFVFGLIAIWYGVSELRLAGANVASTCTVVEVSTRKGKTANDFVPQVRLAHEVGGRRYERLDEGEQRSEREAARALAAFPVGATVPCRYVEGRPDLVVAVEGRRPGGFMLGAGVVIAVIAVVAYFATRKSRPETMETGP